MHALLHYTAGNNIPVWLNEGIAQCYEEMPEKVSLNPYEKAILKQRLDTMPGIDEINNIFTANASAKDVAFAYAYTKALVSYIRDTVWDSSMKYLVDELHNGATVDQAFEKAFYKNVEQMRADWIYHLKNDD
jgi:hypothetical protein